MRHDALRGLGPDLPLADVLVPVRTRTECGFGIVGVNHSHLLQPDRSVQLLYGVAKAVGGVDGVTRFKLCAVSMQAPTGKSTSAPAIISATSSKVRPITSPCPAVFSIRMVRPSSFKPAAARRSESTQVVMAAAGVVPLALPGWVTR